MARGRRRRLGPHGVVVADKPAGPTSHTVVRAVQRRLGAGKAGHAGTLDPAATGVLVVLLGEATKLSDWVMGHDKGYRAWIALGSATDSCDGQGAVVATGPVPDAARDETHVRATLRRFVGAMDQVPPVYAAIKKDGRSLMSRARAGEIVVPDPRPVVCHGLELQAIEGDTLVVDVHCGKGYYVRALARDVGEALGVPAHLSALRRTWSGAFDVAAAIDPGAVEVTDVRPLLEAVPDVVRVVLSAEDADSVVHGRAIAADGDAARCVLLDPTGLPLAMGRRDGDSWRVARGFRFAAEAAEAPEPGG